MVRELEEELSIKIDAHSIQAPLMVTCTTTVGLTAGHTDVSLWYIVQSSRTQEFHYDETEFNSIQWFPFSEAPFHRSDPHLGRFIKKIHPIL